MKIDFYKITKNPKYFKFKLDNISFNGILTRKDSNYISLESTIDGNIELLCNRCGVDFIYIIKNSLQLNIIKNGKNLKNNLDSIEFIDDIIDINQILEGEITILKNDYLYCKDCENSNNLVDLEF